MYMEQQGYGKLTRLLNVFRFWCMLRLLNSMISSEKEAHEKTTMLLESSDLEVKTLQMEASSLRAEILREKEARDAIEDMLQNYKEEVDTLNEALKIAAMDIAEVAQTEDDFALSEEGEEGEDDENEEEVDADADQSQSRSLSKGRKAGGTGDVEFVDAATSKFSQVGNKSAVMRAVMEDTGGYSRGSSVTGGESTSSQQHSFGTSTFLVHEDGTFEQK